MSDRLTRSIWSVCKKVGDHVLTSDIPGREVRNKKRHFTVSPLSLLSLPQLAEGYYFTVFQGMLFGAASKDS